MVTFFVQKHTSNHPEFSLCLLPELEARFEYDFAKETIYNWWTDLSGQGYVGRYLRSAQLIAKHGEKNVVKTQWEIMGKRMILMERLTLDRPDHWVWETHMLGIDMVHDFRLEKIQDGKIAMTIRSDTTRRGFKSGIIKLMIGWFVRKMMIDEWECADKTFRLETDNSWKTVVGRGT